MADTEKLFLGICENEKTEYDALAALLHNSKIECDISAF